MEKLTREQICAMTPEQFDARVIRDVMKYIHILHKS